MKKEAGDSAAWLPPPLQFQSHCTSATEVQSFRRKCSQNRLPPPQQQCGQLLRGFKFSFRGVLTWASLVVVSSSFHLGFVSFCVSFPSGAPSASCSSAARTLCAKYPLDWSSLACVFGNPCIAAAGIARWVVARVWLSGAETGPRGGGGVGLRVTCLIRCWRRLSFWWRSSLSPGRQPRRWPG